MYYEKIEEQVPVKRSNSLNFNELFEREISKRKYRKDQGYAYRAVQVKYDYHKIIAETRYK